MRALNAILPSIEANRESLRIMLLGGAMLRSALPPRGSEQGSLVMANLRQGGRHDS